MISSFYNFWKDKNKYDCIDKIFYNTYNLPIALYNFTLLFFSYCLYLPSSWEYSPPRNWDETLSRSGIRLRWASPLPNAQYAFLKEYSLVVKATFCLVALLQRNLGLLVSSRSGWGASGERA